MFTFFLSSEAGWFSWFYSITVYVFSTRLLIECRCLHNDRHPNGFICSGFVSFPVHNLTPCFTLYSFLYCSHVLGQVRLGSLLYYVTIKYKSFVHNCFVLVNFASALSSLGRYMQRNVINNMFGL